MLLILKNIEVDYENIEVDCEITIYLNHSKHLCN